MFTCKPTVNRWQVRFAAFVFSIAVAASCSPAKNSASTTALVPASAAAQKVKEDPCGQTIRYYIEKALVSNDGQVDKEDFTAVTLVLNPGDKKFMMMVNEANKESTQELRVISCSLSSDMQSGEALYEILESDQQENRWAEVIRVNLKVVADKGIANLSFYSADKPGGVKMTAAKWEAVH